MTADLVKAKEILIEGGYTCVLCSGEDIYTSTCRGVRPLLDFYESAVNFEGFAAADKVVGAGAAYLYVLLGVTELYVDVISESAIAVLERYGILYSAGTVVPQIINRSGDGFCPIESAVSDAETPIEALDMIRSTLSDIIKTPS